jgi:hypothetical protein
MRALLFTLASLAAAGTAGATSIENVIAGKTVSNSVSQVSCGQCPPLVVVKNISYIVPQVAPGTHRIELKQIGGEMKLVRTEAWLGGSPVVFINKASEADIKEAAAKMPRPVNLANAAAADRLPVDTPLTIIDKTAKTGSLNVASMTGSGAVTPQVSHSQEVDLQNFQLRLK